MTKVFFDHNSTTKLAPQVLEKMTSLYQLNLNSSSIYYYGRLANKFVEEARQSIKNLLDADNYRVIFLSGGTEANNLAILGGSNLNFTKILYSPAEHDSVFKVRPSASDIIIVKVNKQGVIDLEDLEEKLDTIKDSNFLVSVMIANNETGAIQPLKEAARLVHQKGGLIHSDIVQGVGKIKIDLEDLNIDFASISAHKIQAPQGIGALLVRKNLDIRPMIFGGGQESGFRSGTLNVAAIAGLGVACNLAKDNIERFAEIAKLRDYLEAKLLEIAGLDVQIFSSKTQRLPNTSYFATKGLDKQMQLIHFDLNNFMVSTGSACSSGSIKSSRILEAMNIEAEFLNSAIRVSLGLDNNEAEIDEFIKTWLKLYNKKYDS
jgi:cysteine desulfurase